MTIKDAVLLEDNREQAAGIKLKVKKKLAKSGKLKTLNNEI